MAKNIADRGHFNQTASRKTRKMWIIIVSAILEGSGSGSSHIASFFCEGFHGWLNSIQISRCITFIQMGWSLSGCQPTRPSVVGMCEDGLCKIKPMLELFTFIYHKGPTLLGYIFRVVKITRIPSQNNVTHRLVAYIQSMNER